MPVSDGGSMMTLSGMAARVLSRVPYIAQPKQRQFLHDLMEP
jgi:hypothetical protein